MSHPRKKVWLLLKALDESITQIAVFFFNFINNKLIFPKAWGKWHKWHLQEEPLSCHDNGAQRFGANMVSDEPHSRQETCALWWLNGRGALGTTSLWKEDGYFTVSRSHSYLLIRFAQSWWNCLYAFDAREKKPLVSRVSRWLRRLLKTTKKQKTNKQKHHWPFIAIRNPASIFLSRVSEIRHLQRDCTRYETEKII